MRLVNMEMFFHSDHWAFGPQESQLSAGTSSNGDHFFLWRLQMPKGSAKKASWPEEPVPENPGLG